MVKSSRQLGDIEAATEAEFSNEKYNTSCHLKVDLVYLCEQRDRQLQSVADQIRSDVATWFY